MPDETESNVLQQRRLRSVLPGPLSGLLNLALIVVISEIVWSFVFSPLGPVRLYTPNLGLALVIAVLMAIHWGMDVFDFWPLQRRFMEETNPLIKGTALTAICVLLGLLIMFVLYNQFIGRFGAIFFSGPMLLNSGGLGQYAQTATENAYYAQIMMNTCIIFFTILWLTSFGYSPWEATPKLTRAFSVWVMGLFLGTLAFVLLFYPHIAYQFYPAQIFMAAPPWWVAWAMTQSSMFHFGWIVPALVMLYWTDMLWEGRPFSLISNTWLRGLVTSSGVVIAGILIMLVTNLAMDWYFDTEAFEGGSTVEQPAWRWNHVAEIFMFMAAASAVLYHYFDNWPTRLNLPLRAVIRTAVSMSGGLALMWLYYRLGPTFLGTVPGVAQEGDTSLAWTVLFLDLVIAHSVFFDGFPFKRIDKAEIRATFHPKDEAVLRAAS
jgi:amino acid transporter, AAT family